MRPDQASKSSWSGRTHQHEGLRFDGLDGVVDVLGGDWQNAVYRITLGGAGGGAVATPFEGSFDGPDGLRTEVKQIDASRVQATAFKSGRNVGSWVMSHLGGTEWGGQTPAAWKMRQPYRWNVEAGGAAFVSTAPGKPNRRWVKAGAAAKGGGEGGRWVVLTNMDMCGQGDVEIVGEWKRKHSVGELRKMAEARGYMGERPLGGSPWTVAAALRRQQSHARGVRTPGGKPSRSTGRAATSSTARSAERGSSNP